MKEDKQLEEKNIKKHLEQYYNLLDPNLRQTFAPIDTLIKQVFSGYDAQFLLAVSKTDGKPRGLLIFNLDSSVEVSV